MVVAVASHVRYPISIAIVLLAVAATAGVFVFARPEYRPSSGVSITLPAKQPANDASGAAGWVWPDGTPGWDVGHTLKGFNVSGVQPVEIQAAQLAAARDGLDAGKVSVLDSVRPGRTGALMILGAPTIEETPARTCLAAVLPGDAPVRWRCPGSTPALDDLAHSPVLLAATGVDRGPRVKGNVLFFVGVARGDVDRVVVHARGSLAHETIYTRGRTWGQFDMGVTTVGRRVRLDVFGKRKHLETLMLNAAPGQQQIFP
jgi:hypothetical protein